MSNRPFRFIHAADLHLEQAPKGVSHVPDHLVELFVESAYKSAERVFETACSEQVDFLVLSGDVLDPGRTGPRGPMFLVEQFEKLGDRGIPVYWAGGRVDSPDSWPPGVRLPENVVYFPMGRPEEIVLKRDSEGLVRLLGASLAQGRRLRPNEYSGEPGGLFTVAVTHGTAQPDSLKRREIEYWALGGRHRRHTLFSGPEVAHYPGTTQGRAPGDNGRFGCTMVDVDERKTIRLSFVPTSHFRWHCERVDLQESHTREDLETILRQRIETLAQDHPGVDFMLSWTMVGRGPLATAIRRGTLAEELLIMVRKEFGFGPPAIWSLTMETAPVVDVPESWFEQESIRADFLRSIRQALSDSSTEIDLTEYLPERYQAGSLSSAALLSDRHQIERVLAEAAMLGVDLLTVEESES